MKTPMAAAQQRLARAVVSDGLPSKQRVRGSNPSGRANALAGVLRRGIISQMARLSVCVRSPFDAPSLRIERRERRGYSSQVLHNFFKTGC